METIIGLVLTTVTPIDIITIMLDHIIQDKSGRTFNPWTLIM